MREVVVVKHDDLDRSPADETVEITVDGVQYEIDLSAANAAELRAMLRPYLEAACVQKRLKRRASSSRSVQPVKAGDQTRRRPASIALAVSDAQERADMRAWANANGHHVATTGVIPAAIQELYRKHGRSARKAKPHTRKPIGGGAAAIALAVSDAAVRADMRAWANANGYEVSFKGVIPADVQRAYRAAQRNGSVV